MMIVAWLASSALAAPTDHLVTLAGGLAETAGPPSVGGALVGRIVVHPSATSRFGFDVGAREGWLVDDARSYGAITIAGRYAPTRSTWLRLAFLHHHETPADVYFDHPVASTLGAQDGIRHRSGAELGLGAGVPLMSRWTDGRLGMAFDIAVGAFPDDAGPPLYVTLEQTWTVGVGRDRP